MENDIDVLGLQEMTFKKINFCRPILLDYKYNIYGNGRYGMIGKIFPISLANETNTIITKDIVKDYKTIKMPWIGSTFPRIITKIVTKDYVCYNTHLDNANPKVKAKQLDFIYNLLLNEKKPVILMGDFNLKTNNKKFKNFISKLKKLHLKRVDNNEYTCNKIKKGPIDHIFLPDNWKVLDISTLKLNISDHKPIIIKVKTCKNK